ncbi:hypothetical protein C8F01DRAFT_964446, partial [Mycena amicta]
INRPFKHAVKLAYHEWLVERLLRQRTAGKSMDLDTTIGTLRDASVGWIWKGYQAIQRKEMIKQAWALCIVRGTNLSYECLTSYETNELLVNLKKTNPQLWNDL